jgi:hypothetical protein
MVMESTNTKMDRGTTESGRTTCKMDKALRSGVTNRSIQVAIRRARSMDMAITNGLMQLCIKESGLVTICKDM